MSYDIYIGEAVIDDLEDDDSILELVVMRVDLPGQAPEFPNDILTHAGNSRHPGYSQWADVLRDTGLYDLFLGKPDGLMCHHPGIARLQAPHLAAVRAARVRWQESHPGAVPGFPKENWERNAEGRVTGLVMTDTHFDPILARLLWLEWWFEWALTNCKRPALYNH